MNEIKHSSQNISKNNISDNLLKSFENLAKELNVIKIGYCQLQPQKSTIKNLKNLLDLKNLINSKYL